MSETTDPTEQRFIDAVLDCPCDEAVGELALRVKDVVAIARWLAPVAARLSVATPGGES